jgi:hypothetical protein
MVIALVIMPFVLVYALYGWMRDDVLNSPPAYGYYAVVKALPNTNVYIEGIAVRKDPEELRVYFHFIDITNGSIVTPPEVICAPPGVKRWGQHLTLAIPALSRARTRDSAADRMEYDQYFPNNYECKGHDDEKIRTDAEVPVNLWGGFELRRDFGKPFVIRMPLLVPDKPASTDLIIDLEKLPRSERP